MAKRERVEELQALGQLMANPAGRRWVRQLLTLCHIWHTSFASNAMRMAFLEGERSIGLFVNGELIEANQDMYLQMLKENANEPDTADNSDADADADASARART